MSKRGYGWENSGGKPAGAKKSTPNETFVDYELSADERAACKAWCPLLADLEQAASHATEHGYRLTCKYEDRNQAYAVFMTASGELQENKDLVLTGRGSGLLKALKQVLFKHFVLFEEAWPLPTGKRGVDYDD